MDTAANKLHIELERIQADIEDLRGRLPAHSVKPAMIQELEELEEQRDALRARIAAMEQGTPHG